MADQQERIRREGLQMLQNLASASNGAANDLVVGENLKAFQRIRQAAGQVSRLAPLIRESQESGIWQETFEDDPKLDQVHVQPVYTENVWSIADDNECYVFPCPFLTPANQLAPQEMAPQKMVTLRYMKTLSSVAIFNMALSCHLQYRLSDNCPKKEVLATRATSLYIQAATLLEECRIEPSESAHVVYLALTNNLIELCLAEGHLCAARHWKERLDDTIHRAASSPHPGMALLHYFMDVQVIYAGTFAAARAA